MCYAGYFMLLCIIITYVYAKITAIPLEIGSCPSQNGSARFQSNVNEKLIY